MNEERIKEIFADEEFVKELFSKETPEEAQALLAEKDINLSVEEIVKLKDIITAKLQAAENSESAELTEADLEDVAGGTFGISVVIAIVGILYLCGSVTLIKTTNRW